jgi:hypothetical protein
MNGQGYRELFERSVALSLTKKVEPKRRQTLFIEEAGQGLVGRTVLTGEKSMAQQGETYRWSVWRAQDRGNAVAVAIMKCQGFFHRMIFQSNRLSKNYFDILELWWSTRKVGQRNTAKTACSPRRYVEETFEVRTPLAEFFGILLGERDDCFVG